MIDVKEIWPKGKQCRDDGYPVCKEPTKTDLICMNCHIKASTVLMTWHTAWNGEERWGRRWQHEDMHTNWSSGLLLFLHSGRWENSTIIYAFPWGKSLSATTSEQIDWTQRGVFLSIVENLVSSTGCELVQSKNPTCLFEAAFTLQFVEFHTEVFHMYGNWLFNAWTEWSAQTVTVAKRKQHHRIRTQKFLQKWKPLIPSITHTSHHYAPKGFPLCKPP